MAAQLRDEWQEHMAAAAHHLRTHPSALSDSIGATVLDDLPELASGGIRREFEMSLAGNLDTTLSMYESALDPRQVPLSTAQVCYARSLARRDVPLSALLNAYRLGQSAFMGLWSTYLAASIDCAPTLASVVTYSNTMLDHYFTRAARSALDAYEAERAEWGRRSGLEMATLTAFLDEREGGQARLDVNGYRLSGHHLGAVFLADTSRTSDASMMLEVGRLLARELSAQQAYTMPITSHCAWAWMGDPRVLSVAEMREKAEAILPPGIRAVFGQLASGSVGFRSTHRQAVRLASMGERIDATSAWYDELEIAVLTSGDEHAVREFIDTNLGGLGAPGAAAAALRETLRVYLAEQGNARKTAERLFLHRNSVVYRIKSAENMLGRPVADGHLALQLALHLNDLPLSFGAGGSSLPS